MRKLNVGQGRGLSGGQRAGHVTGLPTPVIPLPVVTVAPTEHGSRPVCGAGSRLGMAWRRRRRGDRRRRRGLVDVAGVLVAVEHNVEQRRPRHRMQSRRPGLRGSAVPPLAQWPLRDASGSRGGSAECIDVYSQGHRLSHHTARYRLPTSLQRILMSASPAPNTAVHPSSPTSTPAPPIFFIHEVLISDTAAARQSI